MYQELFRFAVIRDPNPTKKKPYIKLNYPSGLDDVDGNVREALYKHQNTENFIYSLKKLKESNRIVFEKLKEFQKKLINYLENNEDNKRQKIPSFDIERNEWDRLKSNLNDTLLCYKFSYFKEGRPFNSLAKLYKLMVIRDIIIDGENKITKKNLTDYLTAPIVYPENFNLDAVIPTKNEIEAKEYVYSVKADIEKNIRELSVLNDSIQDVRSNYNEEMTMSDLMKKLDRNTLKRIDLKEAGDKSSLLMGLKRQIDRHVDQSIIKLRSLVEKYEIPGLKDKIGEYENQNTDQDSNASSIIDTISKIHTAIEYWGATVVFPDNYFPYKQLWSCKGAQIEDPLVMELLIIKQRIKGYRPGEVTHIENVMTSEERSRTHKRSYSNETLFETESQIEQFEERDLQSTEKSEMSREVENVLKEEQSLSAGLNVSASYGTVKMTATGNVDSKASKNETTKSAQKYAKNTIDKALTKVTEKTRKLQSTKIINTTEEVNIHSFNNTGAESKHISGIYQFYDKVYQAKIWNYGQRTLYNIMVPEPAAMYLKAFPLSEENINPIPICPNDIITKLTIGNMSDDIELHKLIQAYGIAPKQKPLDKIGFSWTDGDARGGGDGTKNHYSARDNKKIPDGYKLDSYKFTLSSYGEKATPRVAIHIGDEVHFYKTNTLEEKKEIKKKVLIDKAESIVGNIPVGLSLDDYNVVTVTAYFTCSLLPEGLEQWKRETYELFYTAYKELRERYETAIDEWQYERISQQVEGKNPSINRKIELEEIKRSVIEIFCEKQQNINMLYKPESPQIFDPCNKNITKKEESIELPRIEDFNTRASYEKTIFFIEQAFEWENMTYLFYPYFWGDQNEWVDKIKQDIDDYQFLQFIKAGSARVQIPVRPGFEARVDHFLDTGEVWKEKRTNNLEEGDTEEIVTNPEMLPMIKEMSASLDRSDETPYIEDGQPVEWDVVVPTNLVKLRADDKMPKWWKEATEDSPGEWYYGDGDLE